MRSLQLYLVIMVVLASMSQAVASQWIPLGGATAGLPSIHQGLSCLQAAQKGDGTDGKTEEQEEEEPDCD